MFIAHLPAGYLLGQSLLRRLNRTERMTLLIGSVLPDLDLFLFYLRDGQSVHHHTYLTHRPIVWIAVMCVGSLVARRHRSGRALVVLGAACLLHLALDSVAGRIDWGWPLFDLAGPLITVPATRTHWILSFLTHWTFAVELGICATAVAVWHRATKNPGQ